MLKRKLAGLENTPRTKGPVRLPLVLTRHEVDTVLARLRGRLWLIASLLYGSGLRVQECLSLRVKDLDFERRVLVVRDGKGKKDREQELLGHRDLNTTMIYTHVTTIGSKGVRSPLDHEE